MSRNYGIGARNMTKAANMFLNNACNKKEISFSTVATVTDRFSKFVTYAKENGVGRMERISKELVIQYGKELSDQVKAGVISVSYAQSLVSSINTVMSIAAPDWKTVSPTKECSIAERNFVRESPMNVSKEQFSKAVQSLHEKGLERGVAAAALMRELGLRSKEASLLNAETALKQAQNGYITVSEGTKGGRPREVPVISQAQVEALKSAALVQGNGRSVMPAHENWKTWRNGELRETRESLKEYGFDRLHDLRSAYACDRYQQLTGHAAPVLGGEIKDKGIDKEARLVIANELGHNRIDISAAYIGGR